jgi:hypothetical protein
LEWSVTADPSVFCENYTNVSNLLAQEESEILLETLDESQLVKIDFSLKI